MKTKNVGFLLIALIFSISTLAQKIHSPKSENNSGAFKNITKEDLLGAKNIEDILDSFPKNDLTIINFKFTIAAKGKDLIVCSGFGNQIPPEIKEEIKKLHQGDQLFFEYVRAKSRKSGAIRLFGPAQFVIL